MKKSNSLVFYIFIFLGFYLMGCGQKMLKEPTVSLAEHKKLCLEHNQLKKEFSDFQNTTNNEIAKLHLKRMQDNKRFNKNVISAMQGLAMGTRRALAKMMAAFSGHFKYIDIRLNTLEKRGFKKKGDLRLRRTRNRKK